MRPGGMYQSTAGTSLSRVAHAAAHNTPEGRCVSAGGSTVPLADIFIPHSRDRKGKEGYAKAGKGKAKKKRKRRRK